MTYRWIMEAVVDEYTVDRTNTRLHPDGELDARLSKFIKLQYLEGEYTEEFGYIAQITDETEDGRPIHGSETFVLFTDQPLSKEEYDGIDVPDLETGMTMLLAMYHARTNPQL